MDTIASFQVDHTRLCRGVFVSRVDGFGGAAITTFDIRLKEPNREPPIDGPALHTLEHLGAVYLRNHPEWGPRTVYFGPMGCRTGVYALFAGEWTSEQVLPALRGLFESVAAWTGPVPGASAVECGNWRDHNPEAAAWEARRFLEILRAPKRENLRYPD
jgi:S-ribosylhomocysteine lyase